jgi:CheY-like chemotaxis protein
MAKAKVLLIDDEKDLAQLLALRIKSWGYDFIFADSGKEGLAALEKESPGVIILDYLMPGMDGVETFKEIRKVNKDIPVIMFTAYPDGESMARAKELQASAYVPKLSAYFNPEENLKTAIELVLKRENKAR